jgi:Zn-dependent peptidase ImmA (M78 family)
MICPYRYIRDNNIDFDRYDFGETEGSCMWMGGNAYIGVIIWLSQVREREVLGHEIGHFLDGTTNNMHFSKFDEQKADRSGWAFLVPYDKLISAIEDEEWECDASILACKFGVSFDFMQQRIREAFAL